MFVPPTKEDSIIRFAVSGESHGFRMKLPKGLRVGETVGISIPIQLLDTYVLTTLASKMSKTKDSTEELDPPGHHNIASTARADRVPTNLDHLSGHSHSLSDHHTLPQKVTKNEPDNLDEDDEAPNSPREGEEIVSPLDKHGNSIHRYFVKGHWIVHSSTQKVVKWCPPDPSCTKSDPPPAQLRDQHGALIDRINHLNWLRRHAETHFFKQWSEVDHPLACIREWRKEHPSTQLVLERTNSNGGALPGYVYNPWMFYDRDMFPELWDNVLS